MRRWLPPVLVGIVTFLCFLPTLQNDFVNFDDPENIVDNPYVHGLSLDNLNWAPENRSGHYAPLTWITYGIDYEIWGLDPTGFHLTSLLLHTANAIIVYFLILALLREARWAALGGALFFASHPLRVESVAWATERRDVLSGLFFLLSLLFYLRREHRGYSIGSIFFFALSLLSKVSGLMLPFALLVLDYYPLGRSGFWKLLREKIPYFVLSVGGAGLALLVHSTRGGITTEYTLVERLTQPGVRFWFTFKKMIVPLELAPHYLYSPPEGIPLAPIVGLAALVAVSAGLFWFRKKIPAVLASWVACGILILPVVGLVQFGSHSAADRNTYIPFLPWAFLVGLLLCRSGRVGRGAAAAVGLALAILTFQQTGIWKDSCTLWDHTIKVAPNNCLAHFNRGDARMSRGEFPGALEDYTRVTELCPGDDSGHHNRGYAHAMMGDHRAASRDFLRALELNPDSAKAWYHLGKTHSALGATEEAIKAYSDAIRLNPDSPDAILSRGITWQGLGNLDRARQDYVRALGVAPADWEQRSAVELELRRLRE